MRLFVVRPDDAVPGHAQRRVLRLADIAPGDGHEERRRAKAETITVHTISLNDLLTEHQAPAQIDFLSVDTEGSEFEILNAFDFDRWRIKAIAVEHNGTPARDTLHELLTGKGYRRMWPKLSRWDKLVRIGGS